MSKRVSFFLIHMPRAIGILLFLSVLSSPVKTVVSEIQVKGEGGNCLKRPNYTPNSAYHMNVVSVLSSLTSQSSQSKFYNFTAGEIGPDQVHGLYLCRADLPLSTCQACVNAAAQMIVEKCTNKKEAILWFEECLFRYTNHSISFTLETEPWTSTKSLFNVSRPDIFLDLLNSTMQRIIIDASSRNNSLRFATGKANFTGWETLYGLAQCTPDISASECGDCLRLTLARVKTCCGGLSETTYVGQPSCWLHYDTAPFFFLEGPRPLSPPAPLAPPPASLSPSLSSLGSLSYYCTLLLFLFASVC